MPGIEGKPALIHHYLWYSRKASSVPPLSLVFWQSISLSTITKTYSWPTIYLTVITPGIHGKPSLSTFISCTPGKPSLFPPVLWYSCAWYIRVPYIFPQPSMVLMASLFAFPHYPGTRVKTSISFRPFPCYLWNYLLIIMTNRISFHVLYYKLTICLPAVIPGIPANKGRRSTKKSEIRNLWAFK